MLCDAAESEDAVVLSFDVTALSVHNLVITFEHPHSASLMTGISFSSLLSLLSLFNVVRSEHRLDVQSAWLCVSNPRMFTQSNELQG